MLPHTTFASRSPPRGSSAHLPPGAALTHPLRGLGRSPPSGALADRGVLSPAFTRQEQRLPLLGAKANASRRALSLMLALGE